MNLKNLLEPLGFEVPEVTTPGGSYVSVNIRANIAYIAIQFPIKSGEFLFQGRLGNNVSTAEGCKAMELCALNVMAQIDKNISLDKLIGLNHLDAYFQSGENWDEAPIVVDGASNLFLQVLAEKGVHSRSIVGVHKLPRNFSVGLTATATVRV